MNNEHKICASCASAFSKPPKATWERWHAQRFCSVECSRKSIKHGDALERLLKWSIPEPNSGCWIWLGNIDRAGYGVIVIGGKRFHAHRLSYSLHKGELASGLGALHHCDMPICVNPDHLYSGTPADNARDRVSRNRSLSGSRNPMSKLTEIQVAEIRASSASEQVLAGLYGVSDATIWRIRKAITWRRAL